MLKRFVQIVGMLFAGFCGGVLAHMMLSWVSPSQLPLPNDAIAIANTYIVFTTLIFAGVTVLLAVSAYVFNQHFSSAKSAQEREILEALKDKISSDEQLGTKLANGMLENPDVTRHLQSILKTKVDELIQAHVSDTQTAADRAKEAALQAAALASQLNVNGDAKGGQG